MYTIKSTFLSLFLPYIVRCEISTGSGDELHFAPANVPTEWCNSKSAELVAHNSSTHCTTFLVPIAFHDDNTEASLTIYPTM
jgi:hypothetical protein